MLVCDDIDSMEVGEISEIIDSTSYRVQGLNLGNK